MDKLLINKITVDNAAEANLLFLDTPAGVGFSYSNTSTDYDNLGDDFTGDECMLLFNFPHPHLSQKYFFFGFLWFWLELDEWINLIWWLIFVTVISVYLSLSIYINQQIVCLNGEAFFYFSLGLFLFCFV